MEDGDSGLNLLWADICNQVECGCQERGFKTEMLLNLAKARIENNRTSTSALKFNQVSSASRIDRDAKLKEVSIQAGIDLKSICIPIEFRFSFTSLELIYNLLDFI